MLGLIMGETVDQIEGFADKYAGYSKSELETFLSELPDKDSLRAAGIRLAMQRIDEAAESQRVSREDARFLAQAQQSQRQFRTAVAVACLALAVSLGSLAYTIWRDSHARPAIQSSGSLR